MIGNKVLLRPIVKSDIIFLNEWKNNKNIYKFLGGGYNPISIDQHEKWIDNIIDMTGSNRRFMIVDVQTQVPVGLIGLYAINWVHRTCEVGMFIGEIESRKKGYATEAYILLEKFALSYLNLRKINLKMVSSNDAAFRLWTKLGFTKVGCLHQERYIDGEYLDLLMMEKFLIK